MTTRIEKDSMGPLAVPADAYYGVQTQRAVTNFPISGWSLPPRFIHAMGRIKRAAAKTNLELGLTEKMVADAIVAAASEVVDGKLDAQFPVDIFQTGSGTSTNMNANEVISSRANEILGGKRGDKAPVHPNDHVNLCQSSNDVIPTAIHLSVIKSIQDELIPALQHLHGALAKKATDFDDIIKIGRTHLQDATPVRLGQEFGGYAAQIEYGIARAQRAIAILSELPLGGTAVGSGLNAHPERQAARRAQPLRGVGRARCLRGSQRLPQDHCRQPRQSRQRHPPHRQRPAVRHRGNQDAGGAARELDHAGQGEPGHCREPDPGQPLGHWGRSLRDARRPAKFL